MHAMIPGGRTLAVVAVSLFGIVNTAQAAPLEATKAAAPAAETDLLLKVDSTYTYRERRVTVREYEPGYRDYDYVDDDYDRPYGYVYTGQRYDYDDYDGYDYDPGGVHVRAPFVDIYIP